MYSQQDEVRNLREKLDRMRKRYLALMNEAHKLSDMVITDSIGVVILDDNGRPKYMERNESKKYVLARRLRAQTTHKKDPKHVERRKDPQYLFEFCDRRF